MKDKQAVNDLSSKSNMLCCSRKVQAPKGPKGLLALSLSLLGCTLVALKV